MKKIFVLLLTIFMLLVTMNSALAAVITGCGAFGTGNHILGNDIFVNDSSPDPCISITYPGDLDCIGFTIDMSAIIGPTHNGVSGVQDVEDCTFVGTTTNGNATFINTGGVDAIIKDNTFLNNHRPIDNGFGTIRFLGAAEVRNNVFRNVQQPIGRNTVGGDVVISNNLFHNTTSLSGAAGSNLGRAIFFNNLFNVTPSWEPDLFGDPEFNTTNFNGIRIDGSVGNICGNAWIEPNGFGFSQTCDDLNNDGICDDEFEVPTSGPIREDSCPLTFEGIGPVNNPPSLSGTFAGVTTDLDNFVIRVQMTDVEGGNLFVASQVLKGDEFDPTDIQQGVEFNEPSDLSFVTPLGTPSDVCGNLTFEQPIDNFGSDGSMLMRGLPTSCYPVDVTIPQIIDSSQGPVANLTTSIYFQPAFNLSAFCSVPLNCPVLTTSYDVYSGTVQIGQIELQVDNPDLASGFRVYFNPGFEILFTGTYDNQTSIVIDTIIDFAAQTQEWNVFRNGTQIATKSEILPPTPGGINQITKVRYYANGNTFLETYADYVRTSQPTTAGTSLPIYRLVGAALAGVSIDTAEEVINPDSGPVVEFGTYTARIYGTDDTFGLNFYSNFIDVTFEYNSLTPLLTPEEVASISEDNLEFIEGDFITDLTFTLLDIVGFKSLASRMVLALLAIIFTAWAVTGAGTETQILIIFSELLVLTFIGFLPSWIFVLLSIIAAILIAIAVRRVVAGGGGGGT